MATTEIFQSREYGGTQGEKILEIIYLIEVHNPVQALEDASIPNYGDQYSSRNLYVVDIKAEPVKVDLCKVTVVYKTRVRGRGMIPEVDKTKVEYAFTTQTEHISNTKEDTDITKYGTDSVDSGSAIGEVTDGEIQGVDILSPYATITITTWKDTSDVDNAFRTTLYDAIGTINDGSWKGFGIHTLLFAGVDFGEIESDITELRYTFLFNKTVTNDYTILKTSTGSTETVSITKQGWQYLWIKSGEKDKEVYPLGVYVADIYDDSDFDDLDIPT